MKSISIVSKRIMRIISVSLAYHGKKTEFLNNFVSLSLQRINRIIFVCVPACLLKPCLIKKKKIRDPAMAKDKRYSDAG
jgi:hypothetical protein